MAFRGTVAAAKSMIYGPPSSLKSFALVDFAAASGGAVEDDFRVKEPGTALLLNSEGGWTWLRWKAAIHGRETAGMMSELLVSRSTVRYWTTH